MHEQVTERVELPVGFCATCDREVLTYIGALSYIGADEDDARQCVHCDAPVTLSLRPSSLADLEAAGYVEVSPASSCSSGGCGSGRCGRP